MTYLHKGAIWQEFATQTSMRHCQWQSGGMLEEEVVGLGNIGIVCPPNAKAVYQYQ